MVQPSETTSTEWVSMLKAMAWSSIPVKEVLEGAHCFPVCGGERLDCLCRLEYTLASQFQEQDFSTFDLPSKRRACRIGRRVVGQCPVDERLRQLKRGTSLPNCGKSISVIMFF